MAEEMKFEIDEMDRQLTIRALAVQSLTSPGFEHACRKIAVTLEGEKMFDQFMSYMEDLYEVDDEV